MANIVDQPPPVATDQPAIVDLVVADMAERKRVGIERYGVPLQAGNGRDALVDAYQEALDLVMYLRQAIEERDQRAAFATGGLIPAGARVHIGEDGCMLLVPMPGPADAPLDNVETASAAMPVPAVKPPRGYRGQAPHRKLRKPEAERPSAGNQRAAKCPSEGCGHAADRHWSLTSETAVGCQDCDCPRSYERVANQHGGDER